ncbi:MAG TPA: hypothetical protein VFA39_15575 [Steroidobacteraceae bacterium]|nr:hypothetical protein [Steroidobacteraceae bacterium]
MDSIAVKIIAGLLALAGMFIVGIKVGAEHEVAKHARDEQLMAAVEQRTQSAVADAIAKMKPIHQITRQVLEREVRTVPDYSRCVNSADGMRALNGALTNQPVTARDVGVPDAHPNE